MAAKITRRQRAEGLSITQGNRGVLLQVWLRNVYGTLMSGFSFVPLELPQPSVIRRVVLCIETLIFSWPVRLVGLLLMIVGLLIAFLRRGMSDGRRRWFGQVALLLTFLYFAAFTGTTFSVGWRVIFPAEFTLILLIVAGLTGPSSAGDDEGPDLDDPRRRAA